MTGGFAPRVQYPLVSVVRKWHIYRAGCEMIDAACKMVWRFRAAGDRTNR